MSAASTTAEITVNLPREETFARSLALDPQRITHKYGGLPAVTGLSDQSGPWDSVGRTRRVHLSDGSVVSEELTRVDPPEAFGYRIRDFARPLSALTGEAQALWRFSDEGKSTRITYSYSFLTPNPVARALLTPVVVILWRGSMRAALRRLKAILEGGAEQPRTAAAKG